jgi:hypothetical protein
MMSNYHSDSIQMLSDAEIDGVTGGAIMFIPLAIAFGKGALWGAGVAGLGLIAADVVGLVES